MKVFLEPGWWSSILLEMVGFHFRGTNADKWREVIGHFKQHQAGALTFNQSLPTLGNSQLAASSNDTCMRLGATGNRSSDNPAV